MYSIAQLVGVLKTAQRFAHTFVAFLPPSSHTTAASVPPHPLERWDFYDCKRLRS
jgi:hypothetical protein